MKMQLSICADEGCEGALDDAPPVNDSTTHVVAIQVSLPPEHQE